MVFNPNNMGKSLAFGLASQEFKKVTGNLLGTQRGTTSSPTVSLDNIFGSKRSTDMYQFPIDVDAEPGLGNQGHYIMFNINQQEHAKLKFGGVQNVTSGTSNMEKEAQDRALIQKKRKLYSSLYGNYQNKKVDIKSEQIMDGYELGYVEGIEGKVAVPKMITTDRAANAKAAADRAATGVYMVRKPTVRLKTAITLFMPASVSVSYGANYTDTEIGAGAAQILDVYDQISAGTFGGSEAVLSQLDRFGETLGEGLMKMFLGGLGALPLGMQGVREAAEARAGTIISDRMELAFKGTPKRSFQYTFKMIPKSKQEADEIHKIIKAFKFNMLPEFKDEGRTGRKLNIPNTFDISYMYVGNQNEYLHKIGTSVLESMNVTYGGDRFKTFEANDRGAPPVETSLTLNFKELEMMTRERINEGH